MGRFLVVSEDVASVDLIVVTPEAEAAGLLEAADLFRAGVAKRVAIFAMRSGPADVELRRRGVVLSSLSAQSPGILLALGVAEIERIPNPVSGTEETARALSAWCDARSYRSVVIVSGADHTRRLRRVMRRVVGKQRITVAVRAARYSQFDPEHWWGTRDGARMGIVETQKLLLDMLRHPFS